MSKQAKQLNNIYGTIRQQGLAAMAGSPSAKSDLRNWAARRARIESLQIATETRGQRSLKFNPEQEVLWEKTVDCWKKELPANFVILKSRRAGTSTKFVGVCYDSSREYEARRAKVVGYDWDNSKYLFSIGKMFEDCQPKEEKKRRPLKSDTNMLLQWSLPHGGRFSVSTANKDRLARGELIHYLLLSELGFWEDPHDALVSVLSCIPKNHWDTLAAIESTANGPHNIFHKYWKWACAGKIPFQPIFLSWKDFPERYSVDPSGFEFDEEEIKFKEEYGLTFGQLAWAQNVRKTSCGNSWDMFHQEYPVTPELAFRFTGRPWFLPQAIARAQQIATKPVFRGRLEFISTLSTSVKFVEDWTGSVRIWEHPERDGVYVIGMDVSEGVGASNTVITVLRVGNNITAGTKQVACFRNNNTRADEAGVIAYQLGQYYNGALLGIERNNHGAATIGICAKGHAEYPQMRGGYPYLYSHTPANRQKENESPQIGWHTNSQSRPMMLHHIASAFNRGDTDVMSTDTLYEFEGFSFDTEKQKWCQKSDDPATDLPLDDEIFAYAIALQMQEHYFGHRAIPRPKSGAF